MTRLAWKWGRLHRAKHWLRCKLSRRYRQEQRIIEAMSTATARAVDEQIIFDDATYDAMCHSGRDDEQ